MKSFDLKITFKTATYVAIFLVVFLTLVGALVYLKKQKLINTTQQASEEWAGTLNSVLSQSKDTSKVNCGYNKNFCVITSNGQVYGSWVKPEDYDIELSKAVGLTSGKKFSEGGDPEFFKSGKYVWFYDNVMAGHGIVLLEGADAQTFHLDESSQYFECAYGDDGIGVDKNNVWCGYLILD
ncbi:MAG: hypothetical protein AMXMBFR44_0960 [Candidatus Campbellbacteria bacterium]